MPKTSKVASIKEAQSNNDYSHLKLMRGSTPDNPIWKPGAACQYLLEEHGIELRPTTLTFNYKKDVSGYINGFGDKGYKRSDLDAFAAKFQPVALDIED